MISILLLVSHVQEELYQLDATKTIPGLRVIDYREIYGGKTREHFHI